jgi:L-lactate dehydrogenase complex protein LldG
MKQTARDDIFRRLRAANPPAVDLPDLPTAGPWQTFDDPVQQFADVLGSVGGTCRSVASLSDVHDQLQQLDPWNSASVTISTVNGVGHSTCDQAALESPHQLENVDFAVLSGQLAVAENGAVWVTDDSLSHRVLYFIPQHLALVVPGRAVVNNMHEAYARIAIGESPFAAFISGPSKTADIEQSLVIGAHGARSLTVFLVDELPG